MDIAVPVGTNTGWNLRSSSVRGGELCGLRGSFLSFSRSEAERRRTGDPRLSLEERYKDHDGFVKAVEEAARKLVSQRFLLEEDGETLIAMAAKSDILR